MRLLIVTVLLAGWLASPTPGHSTDAKVVGGIYEVSHGVPSLAEALHYWQAFGFRIARTGTLDAARAEALYGVNSALTTVRLDHAGGADHGKIRLLVWENGLAEGLGTVPLLTIGSRWASTLTSDVMRVWNHAIHASDQGAEIEIVPPQFSTAYGGDIAGKPFIDPLSSVREMIVLTPLTRRMFYQRFDYVLPNYGWVDEDAPMKTAQITHVGLVWQSDDEATSWFYRDVLGLHVLSETESYRTFENLGRDAVALYGMQPGDAYHGLTYDDPRNAELPFDQAWSGRLLLRRIPARLEGPDLMDRAQPGAAGLTLFTYRVDDLAAMRERLLASAAREVSPILPNAFGEPALGFRAPDGHRWMLIEQE